MKKFYIIFVLFALLSGCQRKRGDDTKFTRREFSTDSLKKYNFKLLTTDYEFELTTKKFKIDFYKFTDTIRLSKTEEREIAQIFFENYIDTLKVDIVISDPKEPDIMPNFGDSFYVYHNDVKKSFFRIINGKYESLDHLSPKEKNIFLFRNNLISILEKNSDFKRCLDTLKAVKKYDKRVFL